MSEISDDSIKKLSEAIIENNEIITDVNSIIKEMKGVKEVTDEIFENFKKRSDEFIEDLDEIMEVINVCKEEDDSTLKSFDSKKKTAKSNNEKSKKQMMDALSKLENMLIKSKDTDSKKKKGILKIGSKKNEEDSKNKKTEKDKSKDPDAVSTKSGAGSSVIEDLDEEDQDFESNNEKNNDEENNKLKVKIKKKQKDSESGKEKKKSKDKIEKKDSDKKSSKNKEKSEKEDKSDKSEKGDNQSEVSFIVEEDEKVKGNKKEMDKNEDKTENNEKDKTTKDKKKEKDKTRKDKNKEKNEKSGDIESIGTKNEDPMIDDVDDDEIKNAKTLNNSEGLNENKKKTLDDEKKKKKKGDKKSIDNGNIKDKDNDSAERQNDDKKEKVKEKRNIFKRSKSKTSSDQESLGDKKEITKDSNNIKKDKKNKKSDDVDSIGDKSENSLSKDKNKKEKKKDKKLEDTKVIEGKVEKSERNDDETIFETKINLHKAEKKDIDSDNEIRTPSIRTEDSLKTESEYDENFTSDEEKSEVNVVMEKAVIVESKKTEDSMKPTTSLKRQQYVDSEEERTSKIEGELLASTTFENIGVYYIVTKAFKADGEDDLSGYIGEELTILEINDDGWWLAKNKDEVEGFVPVECLKPKGESKEFLDDSQDNKDISDNMIIPKDSKVVSEGFHNDEGTQLWDQIQQAMKDQSNEKQKGISDVLKTFGSLPAGFRFSTLAVWSSKNTVECSMKSNLYPKLSESDLSFKDLQHNSVENKIRPRPVRIQRTIQIIKAVQMPATSEKFVVKSRHIRICLFNCEKAISNIHMMRATVIEKDTRTWNFNSKVTDSTNSLDYNEIFLRSNYSGTDLSILLEFCMLGFKSKSGAPGTSTEEVDITQKKGNNIKINEEFNDDELVEFSVGWTKIPLYEENGQLITNKNGDYELFGGTPYEVSLEVDPNIGRTEAVNCNLCIAPTHSSSGKFKSLLSQNKQPQVSIRLFLPNKENKEYMETLPDVMLGSTLHITNFSFYRRILSEELMNRRQNHTSAEPIYSPFLVSFIEVAQYSDMLDTLRTIWIEKVKTMKNLDKKDYSKMNKAFKDVFIEYMYPLSKITSLQSNNLARQDIDQMRSVKIKEFVQRVKTDKLSVLLSGDYTYKPLSFDELSYKVVSKYSKAIKT